MFASCSCGEAIMISLKILSQPTRLCLKLQRLADILLLRFNKQLSSSLTWLTGPILAEHILAAFVLSPAVFKPFWWREIRLVSQNKLTPTKCASGWVKSFKSCLIYWGDIPHPRGLTIWKSSQPSPPNNIWAALADTSAREAPGTNKCVTTSSPSTK